MEKKASADIPVRLIQDNYRESIYEYSFSNIYVRASLMSSKHPDAYPDCVYWYGIVELTENNGFPLINNVNNKETLGHLIRQFMEHITTHNPNVKLLYITSFLYNMAPDIWRHQGFYEVDWNNPGTMYMYCCNLTPKME